MKGIMAILCTGVLLLGWGRLEGEESGSFEACSVMSNEEVQNIVGEPIGDPEKGPEFPKGTGVAVSQCSYSSVDGSKSLTLMVRISSVGDNDPDYAKRVMTESGVKVEDVSGVADAAFWSGMQLQAFKGKNIQVIVSVFGFENEKEKAVQVAQKAIGKL
jgi:hypothetical protein